MREISVAVGGDMAMRHGMILAKSIPAKKYGIQTGETILEVQRKSSFIDISMEYSDIVEQYSIDEAFIDMTAGYQLLGELVEEAEQTKERIKEKLEFTVNVGVSGNKLLAKL